MRHSIRWRFTIPFVLFLVLTIAVLSIYLLNTFNQAYLDNIQTNLLAETHLVVDDVTPLMADPAREPQIESLSHRFAGFLQARVTIIRPDGVVLGESDVDPASMENHLNRPEVQQALNDQEGYQIRYSATLRTDMLYVASPVKSGGQIVGVVRLARPLARIESQLDSLRSVIYLATFLTAIFAFLIAILIANYTIRPLVQLTTSAQELAAGKYHGTSLLSSQNEIGQLNYAFNQMALQIQAQIYALQSEQGKLSSVLEQMMDGVVIVDADGQVQLINPAARLLLHTEEESPTEHSLIEVVRHHQVVDLWRKSLATGEQQTSALDVGPEHLHLQGIATPLNRTLPDRTLLLFQDLTLQRKLETVRQDFISNVSHELRTPLASLKALTETLQESALEDPPAARRFLERMEIEIDTLTQMVHELLELSRIESGRVPLKKKPLTPLELLTPAVERMRLQAERAGLSLTLDLPGGLPQVLADADRMEQVLINLLHNAIKFTPPDGKITVSAASEGNLVVFRVKDTGVGISPKDLPRIFERFYKADRARSGGGTGLGLSIARHIIEAHGGRIWAESVQGQGSTFSFSLSVAGNPNAR